ncbi:MAG: DUF416 family protein [Byssovorax sp.]
MRTFDESNLIAALERLPAPLRVVFAAACAERQMPAYRRFEAQNGQDAPNALDRALADAWMDPSPVQDREGFNRLIEELMALVPQEEGFRRPWTQDATNAQNAGMAAVYVLRTKLAGEAQEAAWTARVAYEALDNFVINSAGIDMNKPGEEPRVIAHPLVQAELDRQQRDLDELGAGDRDQPRLCARLRARAVAEAAIFFGPHP